MKTYLKTKNEILSLVLVLSGLFLILMVKNTLEDKNQSVGYAASKSDKSNMEEKYGNCSYYKAQTEEIKKAFMRDLGITSDENLAAFLENLKNNSGARREFRENKKPSSYNIELLFSDDLEDYEEAIKQICESDGKEIETIKTNMEIIKILAEGLKSNEIPEDKIDDIWPKDYLEKEQ